MAWDFDGKRWRYWTKVAGNRIWHGTIVGVFRSNGNPSYWALASDKVKRLGVTSTLADAKALIVAHVKARRKGSD